MSNQLHYNCLYHSKCRFYICMVFFRYCVRLWKISRCVSHDVNMTTKCWFLEWKLDPFSIFCIFFAFPAVWNTIQSIFFFFCLFHSVTKWNKKLTPDTEFSTKLNKQKKTIPKNEHIPLIQLYFCVYGRSTLEPKNDEMEIVAVVSHQRIHKQCSPLKKL